MTLAEKIVSLRQRTLTELRDAHDYYANTKAAWEYIVDDINAGGGLTIRNDLTGSNTGSAELAKKADGYVKVELAEATFQQFIAIFESFLFDFLRIWLAAYPQNLFGRKVDFRDIYESQNIEAVTLLFVNKELNELLYDRPVKWFEYIEDKMKLDCPSAGEIAIFAEAKATRDVLVHNCGDVGKTYAGKAGRLARYEIGEQVEIMEPYHRQIWSLLCKIADDMGEAALVKTA